MIKYFIWTLLWPLLFLVKVFAWFMSPLVSIFIVTKLRQDKVKRFNKQQVLLNRDSLVWWLTWFDTDDNATDEYWYGMYGNTVNVTQEYYGTHKLYRWYCRTNWLMRNSAYTFNRKFFGLDPLSKLAWQYKAQKPLFGRYYNDINIGYKVHKGFDKLMYAGRILGIRKF